jgi:hypothetical protein
MNKSLMKKYVPYMSVLAFGPRQITKDCGLEKCVPDKNAS